MADILTLTTTFVGFLYWPLLYVNLRGAIYGSYELTKKKIAGSLAITTVLSAVALKTGYMSGLVPYVYSVLMLLVASVAVVLLIVRTQTRRTKAKVIILAVYLHAFWQILPATSPVPVLIDIVGVAILLVVIKLSRVTRIKVRRDERVLSISELWR